MVAEHLHLTEARVYEIVSFMPFKDGTASEVCLEDL